MTTQPVSDPSTPIGEILKAAGAKGVLLESEDYGSFAVMPLDDDLIDYLIERDPRFRGNAVRFAAGWTRVRS